MKWGMEKKWTAEGGRVLYYNFSAGISDGNRIIFFWAVALNSVSNFCRYLIDFRTKILKIPLDFLMSVGKSVGNCMLEHAHISFAASFEKVVGNCADRKAMWQSCVLECAPSINESIGDYGRGRNFFATLGEIPTSHISSV